MLKKSDVNDEEFISLLSNCRVPLLVLDKRWYNVFQGKFKSSRLKEYEDELNGLLKLQGKLINENKTLKASKKKIMSEIVKNMDDSSKKNNKKLSHNGKLIEDVNVRIEENEDELASLPRRMQEINEKLMVESMRLCYVRMNENFSEIENIVEWVNEIKEEVKTNMLKKQQMEEDNARIYSYMHDMIGPKAMELFDKKQEEDI